MTQLANPPRLVGDIGGTNARLALLDTNGVPVMTRAMRCDEFSGLHATIEFFLRENNIERIEQAAVAVACPVDGDRIELTNSPWSFSIRDTEAALQLSPGGLQVLNDFTALALSVPLLSSSERVQIGSGEPLKDHTVAVIGPGTGLGVSGLIPSPSGWIPLQGEGGHVSLGVRTDREMAVYEVLKQRFRHVSAERFLCGEGLQNIHQSLLILDGVDAQTLMPQEITRLALAGEDASCRETLEIFCELLGSCAGNLALTLGAKGGVYIGGGIVPRLGDYFAQSGFRAQFEAKGRFEAYLSAIPTYVITAPYPALTGAAQLLS